MFVELEAYVAVVRALRHLGVGKLVAAFLVLDEADKRLSLVHSAESFPDILIRNWLFGENVNGGEYASDHVDGVRSERHRDRLACYGIEFLLDLGDVAVPHHLIGSYAAETFRMIRGDSWFAASSCPADFKS